MGQLEGMVKASEIRDWESLKLWLKGRPREDAVMIAHRAACRLLPVFGANMEEMWAQTNGLTALPVLRANLTSGVATKQNILDVITGGVIATEADNAGLLARNHVAGAYIAAVCAANAVGAVATADASHAVNYAIGAEVGTAAARTSISDQIILDAERLESGSLDGAPLWHGMFPDWFSEADRGMRAVWSREPPGRWAFWIRWWDGVLSGRPVDWELQRQVAEIPHDTWLQGPDAVAVKIDEIERSLRSLRQTTLEDAIRQNPFALRIDVDAGSSTFVADELRRFDHSEIIEAVATSIRDFTRRTADMMSGNQPGRAMRETVNLATKELRRDLKRYADSPLKLHDAIGDAIQEVVASARREGVQSEPVLQRLIGVWARQQTDLCGTCPELLETVQRRTMVQVKLFTEAELRQALTLGQGLHDRSSGYLRVAAAWALKTIQDPSRPKEELQSAWYFLAAVLPRGADAAIRFEEGRKSAKEGGVAKKIKDAADIAVAGDKIVDVAQENASEIWDFGHWVASEIMSGNWFGSGGGLG